MSLSGSAFGAVCLAEGRWRFATIPPLQAILEYDDLRMLRALGNIVFPLGEALARLEVTGCCDDRGAAGILLSTKFVDQFDLAIVMHDAETLVRPVAWRTVGQDMTVMEARIG